MKARISEIFESIQGEGVYLGARQVFVRFAGCNLRCVWCDTPRSLELDQGAHESLKVEEVQTRIAQAGPGCPWVSLTGGEPLLQKDFIKDLLPALKSSGLRVYLDTNGTFHQELAEVIDGVDVVAMDIKLPSSLGGDLLWAEHEAFLKIARQKDVFVKVVVTTETAAREISRAVDIIRDVDFRIPLILQPNSHDDLERLLPVCLDFQKTCLGSLDDVRVIPQVHKLLGVR